MAEKSGSIEAGHCVSASDFAGIAVDAFTNYKIVNKAKRAVDAPAEWLSRFESNVEKNVDRYVEFCDSVAAKQK